MPRGSYDRIILTVGTGDIRRRFGSSSHPAGGWCCRWKSGGQKSIAFEYNEDHLASLSIVDCGFMLLQGALHRPRAGKCQISPRQVCF
jgi:hypothetical protein